MIVDARNVVGTDEMATLGHLTVGGHNSAVVVAAGLAIAANAPCWHSAQHIPALRCWMQLLLFPEPAEWLHLTHSRRHCERELLGSEELRARENGVACQARLEGEGGVPMGLAKKWNPAQLIRICNGCQEESMRYIKRGIRRVVTCG
jgi:hypothetical protein